MDIEKRVLTVAEVAKALRICRPLAYKKIREGQIPAIKVGDRYLIPPIAFDKMLSDCKAKTPSGAS